MSSIRQYLVSLLLLVSLVTPGAATVAAQATPEATADTITIVGGAESPVVVSVADLQALPTETLDVTYLAGGEPQEHSFTGTPLLGVLESVGLPWDEDARNPWLGHIVLVTATDGYQVAFGGGELDPNFGNVPIYLAWEMDGAPLPAEDGAVRVVVPGDTRGGRYVSLVETIEIIPVTTLEHEH